MDSKKTATASQAFILETIAISSLNYMNQQAIAAGKSLAIFKEEKLYTLRGYKTFQEYLSSLGIMPRSARRYIAIVEKYINELKVEEERLYSITPARLEKMIPFANSENIDEWLANAETNSNKDFIDLVNEGAGRPPLIDFHPGERAGESLVVNLAGGESNLPRLSPPEYMAKVKKADCVLCPGKKNYGRGHHFPVTVGAGAKKWWVIPLCETCHVDAHHNPRGFLWKYKKRIMEWIYNLIVEE